ncbi:MAG: ISAzo13 family transposase [Chloroflexota bacterium]
MQPFSPEVEQEMKKYYETLSEKDQRHFAALMSLIVGQGGQKYIAERLGCSERTVERGVNDLESLPEQPKYDPRIRKPGGGRKTYDVTYPEIDRCFLEVVKGHTAGDPMDETKKWTDLTPQEIADWLEKDHQIRVSHTVVRKLLKKHHFGHRQAQKKQTQKNVPGRDEQFKKIAQLKAEYQAAGNPIISIDTKKKEALGNFYREGKLYTQQEVVVFDHDFPSLGDGTLVPYGIYDVVHNLGYMYINTSKDTSEFVCDCIRLWWNQYGKHLYPKATSILALSDGGGSNSASHYIFKEDLQKLVDGLGVELRIAHYPAYCSKFNPIEHRLFSQVTRACQGVIFTSVALVKELMEKTKTNKGLHVFVDIIDKVYQTGREVAKDFKETMRIVFDEVLPKWNYVAKPLATVI